MGEELCRKCQSNKLEYFKRVHIGKKQKQYHYLARCLSCKTTYYVPRDKTVFEKVKDQTWRYAKRFYKRNLQGTQEQVKAVQLGTLS